MPPPKFTPHPQSAPGDFYVENQGCTACGVPHVVAPDLMAWADDNRNHCIWKRQPQTPQELDQAVAVLESQELGCHRYAGDDPAILKRIPAEYCDTLLPQRRNGTLSGDLSGATIDFKFLDEGDSFLRKLWSRIFGKKSKKAG